MMNRLSARCVFLILGAALLLGMSYAQDKDAKSTEPEPAAPGNDAEPTAQPRTATRELLMGADANNDGIRDDLPELLSMEDTATMSTKPASTIERELAAALANSEAARPTAAQPSCLDYLLMDPKDQAAASRYIQARTNGVFGAHPCDPVVSPLIERPFETDFARLHLGPVQLNYAKYE
jgi:hypothetical protein